MPRIAIIGTGGMAATHAQAYRSLRSVELVACCDIVGERADAFAKKWAIPRTYTNPEELLDAERPDGVSIVTPDASHAPIAIQALERKVAVLSEKPMAPTLEEARRMLEAARRSGVIHMVNYSKRESAGLQGAHRAIAAGEIGRVKHVEASYLQGWLVTKDWGDWRTSPAFTWRLSKAHGSMGTLGDIGCHIYDLAAFLCGDFTELSCRLATFDKGVPDNRIGEYVLDANDSFVANVSFTSGAIGAIHATRWATGVPDRVFTRVYGDGGTIDFDLSRDADGYQMFRLSSRKWETVRCRKTPSNYERFAHAIESGQNDESSFENGFKIQLYLDASVRSSEQGRTVPIQA